MKAFPLAFGFSLLAAAASFGANLYWDPDGVANGNSAGNFGGSGTWQDGLANWNTSWWGGDGSIVAWSNANFDTAIFSDLGSPGTVTVSGVGGVNAAQFRVGRGGYVFEGGMINIAQPSDYQTSIETTHNTDSVVVNNAINLLATDQTNGWRYRIYSAGTGQLILNGDISFINAGGTTLSGTRSIDFDQRAGFEGRIAINGSIAGGVEDSSVLVRFGENSASSAAVFEMNGGASTLKSTDRVVVNRGTVLVGNAASLGAAAINVGSGQTHADESAALLTSGAITITNTLVTGNSGSTGASYIYGGNTADVSEFSGNLTVYNDMPLTLRAAAGGTVTFSGQINRQTSQLIKDGAGTVRLTRSAGNYAAAASFIREGTLLVMNTSGSGLGGGAVTVEDGATLGGDGRIDTNSALFTVESGATLLGGDGETAAGSLIIAGHVTFDSGSRIALVLGPGFESSSITREWGNWSFADDMVFDLSFLSGSIVGRYENVLTGLEVGSSVIGANWTIAGGAGSFEWDGNGNVDLVITAVPEPSVFGLLGVGAMVLVVSRRRRFLKEY